MTEEVLAATAIIDAAADTVFDLLADPSTHAALDGTGNVRHPVDTAPLTGPGQIFRMAMFHEQHPNKDYEMSNRVEVFDRPRAIAWQPGTQARHIPGREAIDDDTVEWGGWIWRYDLAPIAAGQTEVTLSYDWSGVPPSRRDITFPPFPAQYLDDSLQHLAALTEKPTP